MSDVDQFGNPTGGTASFAHQLRLLADENSPIQSAGLRSFANLSPVQLGEWYAVFTRLSPSRRRSVIHTMTTLAEDNVDLDFRDLFVRVLADNDSDVRLTALHGLWDDDRLSTMRQVVPLVDDRSSDVCAAALTVLGQFAYQAELGALPPAVRADLQALLLAAASDAARPLATRRCAIESLGYLSDEPRVHDVIAAAYEETDLGMRESAVVAMGRTMNDAWFPLVQHELRSDHPRLRFVAAQAVGELAEDGEPLLEALVPLVDDDDTDVSLAAIWALGQVGGEHSTRVLRRLVKSNDATRSNAAQDALEELML